MSTAYEIPEWGDLHTIGFDERPQIELWDSREEMLAELKTRGVPLIETGPHCAQAESATALADPIRTPPS